MRVEKIVRLVSGVMVTPEVRGLVSLTVRHPTCRTPKDLSAHESEERECGESVGLYAVYMRERGGWGAGTGRVRAI